MRSIQRAVRARLTKSRSAGTALAFDAGLAEALRLLSNAIELIARFLFYDVWHAPIAGTDEDHRVVVLDKELIRLGLWHFLHDLGRQWVQFDVLRHDIADGVGRRSLLGRLESVKRFSRMTYSSWAVSVRRGSRGSPSRSGGPGCV